MEEYEIINKGKDKYLKRREDLMFDATHLTYSSLTSIRSRIDKMKEKNHKFVWGSRYSSPIASYS